MMHSRQAKPSPTQEKPAPQAFAQRAERNRSMHAVAELLHEYEAAWNRLDSKQLLELFTHDAMFVYGGRALRSGRRDMSRAVERMLDPDHRVRLEIDDLKMHGVIAYAKTTIRWFDHKAGPRAKPTCEKRGLFVLRRGPDGWQIAHHILSRVLAAAE